MEPGSSAERRCKALNVKGEPCGRRGILPSGFCPVHDPESPQDMRATSRKGKRLFRRTGDDPETETLREVLRSLSPEMIRRTVEEILAGDNATAKVAAVRLLAQVGEQDKDDRTDRDIESARQEAREKLAALLLAEPVKPQLDESRADRLQARVAELEEENRVLRGRSSVEPHPYEPAELPAADVQHRENLHRKAEVRQTFGLSAPAELKERYQEI